MDPTTADPRDLMQALLPSARAEYIRAWEFLADAGTPLDRRRAARERAKSIAGDHTVVAEFLRDRETSLGGDALLNARHLASELERHAEALGRLAEVSPIGLLESKSLRPEALGCGKRYRDPSRKPDTATTTRGTSDRPSPQRGRDGARDRDRARDGGRGARSGAPDRGPKVPRDALGSSKHDSQLGDDLDPETRAKLDAMRKGLEG